MPTDGSKLWFERAQRVELDLSGLGLEPEPREDSRGSCPVAAARPERQRLGHGDAGSAKQDFDSADRNFSAAGPSS